MARAWDEEDLPALGDYVKTMPVGQNRDTAVVALTQRLINRVEADFPLALEWVEFLGDTELRGEQREWVQNLWRSKSPTASNAARKEQP